MGKKRVLVVDDEENIRNVLQSAFSQTDYDVLLVESAEKAMDILSREIVMVMYIDLNLPEMNGIDLCRKIRIENPLAVLHAITGYSDLFGLIECRKAGFDDFFAKPFSLKTILKSAGDAFEKIERWEIDDYNLSLS